MLIESKHASARSRSVTLEKDPSVIDLHLVEERRYNFKARSRMVTPHM